MGVTGSLRWLVLHLPAFRLERCGYGAGDLVALVAVARGTTRIVGLGPSAQRVGLRRGMTATEARALVPEIELLPWDEAGEQIDRHALLKTMEVLSDQVSSPWEDSLLIEVSRVGTGEAELARRAVELARSLGHAARAAIADDPLAARAVALWIAEDDGSVVVAPGGAASVLAPLPVQALAPDTSDPVLPGRTAPIEELFDALRSVGVETVGRWAALDPAAVIGRYGPLAGRLHRVARGGTSGLLTCWRKPHPHELPSVWTPMAGATTRQELAFVLPGLIAALSAALAAQDRAAARLRVCLKLEGVAGTDATHTEIVRIGQPTRSARTIERLVASRLERVTVSAPIEELGIEVTEAALDGGWQPGLESRAGAGEALPELVARLADQLGDQALRAPVLEELWRPESAWRDERFPRPFVLSSRRLHPDDPVEALERWEANQPLPRPSILLPVPQPIEVSCQGSRPARMRLGSGPGWKPITRAAGPERLWGEWWTARPFDREYWVLEADGRIWWVYREPTASDPTSWWAHGFFD